MKRFFGFEIPYWRDKRISFIFYRSNGFYKITVLTLKKSAYDPQPDEWLIGRIKYLTIFNKEWLK